MDNPGFESAQAGRARCEFERRDHSVGGFVSAAKFRAEHSGECGHLRFRQFVLRMRSKTRVVDLLDLWVSLQKSRESHRILIMTLDAQPQGPQPTKQQPSVK